MLDIKDLLLNRNSATELLKRRGFDLPIDQIESLDFKRRSVLQELEARRAELKAGSKAPPAVPNDAERKAALSALGSQIATLEGQLSEVTDEINAVMLNIPNLPAERTPIGFSEADNSVVETWGQKRPYDFIPKSHDVLGEQLGILDFRRGVKLAGSRFSVLSGAGARLSHAIASFLLDAAIQNGYTQVSVPYMVNRATMTATGQLPKFESELFRVTSGESEWFLIPTAEVPVTNLHADEVLPEAALPLSYCSLSPCFRAEAGSAGRDIKGLIRQHQFDKVELVKICTPDSSWDELEKMLSHAKRVLEMLGLHYRVVTLCTRDIGFHVRFTYDLEVWLPGQNQYREISSCSNCWDFQARRGKIRYKRQADSKNGLVHTLNGSALPIGRTMVGILEQYQTAEGAIQIPDALIPYTKFSIIHPSGKVE
ncbi:MAG: serine--tRNA ligase [Chthoniobacter sp.]|nr:serine--tRNA ligase [Chthoniobacter sp.]